LSRNCLADVTLLTTRIAPRWPAATEIASGKTIQTHLLFSGSTIIRS
jgi:hypothetical protein